MSVGVVKIDDDHKAMIRYLNDLEMATTALDFDERRVAKTVLALFEYTRQHFDREEKLMLAVDFPEFTEHKKAHDDVRRKLHDIGLNFMQSPSREEAQKIQEFVSDWLLRHIIMSDTKITPYVSGEPSPVKAPPRGARIPSP